MKLFPSLNSGSLAPDDAVKATALIAACAVPPGAALGLYFGFRWNKSSLHGPGLQDAAIQAGAGELLKAPPSVWSTAHRDGAVLGVKALSIATVIVAAAGYAGMCATYGALGVSDMDGFVQKMREHMPKVSAIYKGHAKAQSEWIRPLAHDFANKTNDAIGAGFRRFASHSSQSEVDSPCDSQPKP